MFSAVLYCNKILYSAMHECRCDMVKVLDIALLHDEHMLSSALQSRKWQLIGMS